VDASSGLVKGISAGTATITYKVATGCNAPQSASKTVTVSPNVSAGTVSGTSPLCIGATCTYSSTGGTAGGSWSSSNASIATVNASSGLVKGIAAGTATITYKVATGCNSPQSASKTVTVSTCTQDNISTDAPALVSQRPSENQVTQPNLAPFNVRVMPNPTSNYFTLQFNSQSYEKLKITVIDVTGRMIEQNPDVPANSTLQLGSKYYPGVYIAEILQGKNKVVLRLIKGGD
jgi:Secretion system C-terminal sorting domain